MATVGAARSPSNSAIFILFMLLFFICFFVGVSIGKKYPSSDWQRLRLEHNRAKAMLGELSTCQEAVNQLVTVKEQNLGRQAAIKAERDYLGHTRLQLIDQLETCGEQYETTSNEESMCKHQAEELINELRTAEFVREGGTNAQLLIDLANHNVTSQELQNYANELKQGKTVKREHAVHQVLRSLLRLRARIAALESKCAIPTSVREKVAAQQPDESEVDDTTNGLRQTVDLGHRSHRFEIGSDSNIV